MTRQDIENTTARNLIEWGNIFLSFTNEHFHTAHIKETDRWGQMIYLFLQKQMMHLETILMLSDKGSCDILLVTRSILEGIAQLKWAAKDIDKRVWRWFEYKRVLEAKAARNQERNGHHVSDEKKEALKRYFDGDGKIFLDKNGNYIAHWSGRDVSSLIDELSDNDGYYRLVYSFMSNWHHWLISGIESVLKKESASKIVFNPYSKEYTDIGLITALVSIKEMLQIFIDHFNPADKGIVLLFMSKFDKWLTENGAERIDKTVDVDSVQNA